MVQKGHQDLGVEMAHQGCGESQVLQALEKRVKEVRHNVNLQFKIFYTYINFSDPSLFAQRVWYIGTIHVLLVFSGTNQFLSENNALGFTSTGQ